MKKDLIFGPALILVAVALFLLKLTGMTAHIAISIVGLALLVVYAVLTKKEWKIPALEIIMRALFCIALISGIVVFKVHGITALAIIHKISALLSFVSLIVLFVHKIIKRK